MKPTIAIFLILFAGPALAHPGHLAELAGHTHWVAAGALGTAILVGLWGAMTGKKKDAGDPTQEAADADEAAA